MVILSQINIKTEILDTYEGMASLWDGDIDPDGRWDDIFNRIEDLEAEIAALNAQYNSILAEIEGDAA